MKENELHLMWKLFVKEWKLNKDLEPILRKSLLRSKRNNVDPFQTVGKVKDLRLFPTLDEIRIHNSFKGKCDEV
ncbi:hypothetical protein [Fictibacillus sp. FJAT-27399]|uniref:hypothetical protein n=1 Tax=Fictibacillus sp. FJAT-27399 TaxID=1729689 RepID=UPI000781C792|nr:hypothetical protein [Fictibacillus sp. FJAT-27399]